MLNSKPTDRSTWVLQREYRNSSGVMQTEYRDSSGKIHTESIDPNGQESSYQSGYIDGGLVENMNQEQREKDADNNTSKGLLIGVIVACVVGLTTGAAYYLSQVNNSRDPVLVNTPIYRDNPNSDQTSEPTAEQNSDPSQTPDSSPTVIEKSVTNNITPAESSNPDNSEPQDVNVTVKNESAAPKAEPKTVQPKPATANAQPPAQPTPANAPPAPQAKPIAPMAPVAPPSNANNSPGSSMAKTDSELKSEIVKEFNQQFANNQLSVDVNQGVVKVSGTVNKSEQLEQIQPLLQSIEGVNKVNVKVTLNNPAN